MPKALIEIPHLSCRAQVGSVSKLHPSASPLIDRRAPISLGVARSHLFLENCLKKVIPICPVCPCQQLGDITLHEITENGGSPLKW